jgi:uncharacterized protein YdeI (YjbR/CyaY-like superfamily)
MTAAGLAAFERRSEERTGIYSFERPAALDPAYERELRANSAAWADFEARPPSYRKAAISWVMSAKREETRHRRLATLVADSAAGRAIKPLRRPGG